MTDYLKVATAAVAVIVVVLARRSSSPPSLAGFHLSTGQRQRHRQLTKRARRMTNLRDVAAMAAVVIAALPL